MSATIETTGRGGVMTIRITGAASTANAGLGSIANPEAANLRILRGTLRVLTPSTGSAAVSIGITTAAVAATDILNALDLAVTAGNEYNCFAMQNTAKTQITAPALWTPTTYLTITGAATTAGLDAILMLEYVRVDS